MARTLVAFEQLRLDDVEAFALRSGQARPACSESAAVTVERFAGCASGNEVIFNERALVGGIAACH